VTTGHADFNHSNEDFQEVFHQSVDRWPHSLITMRSSLTSALGIHSGPTKKEDYGSYTTSIAL
jgi:hypothetical protein